MRHRPTWEVVPLPYRLSGGESTETHTSLQCNRSSKLRYMELKKKSIFVTGLLSLSLFAGVQTEAANSATFAEYSGKILKSDGTAFMTGVAQCNQSKANLSSTDGTYKIICDTSGSIIFTLYNFIDSLDSCDYFESLDVKSASQVKFYVDLKNVSGTTFSVTMPAPITISLTVVDAQDKPIIGYSLQPRRQADNSGWDEFDFKFTTTEGIKLQGSQNLRRGCGFRAKSNPVIFALYPGDFLGSLTVYASSTYTAAEQRGMTNSGPIYGFNSQSIKVCIPVNFGASLTLPADCYDGKAVMASVIKAERDKAAAERAALEKVARDKAALDRAAEAERVAAQKAATMAKKTTVTCVKGKVSKKVTSVNPKCPSGYKLKR
jgi:hypothetical protein